VKVLTEKSITEKKTIVIPLCANAEAVGHSLWRGM